MIDTKTMLTAVEAAELLECTARTILNMISKGKLSAKREDGKFLIDKSEFFRLYPKAHKNLLEKADGNKDNTITRIEIENNFLNKMVGERDKIILQKETEIEFLRKQIESHNKERLEMLNKIPGHKNILEDMSEDPDMRPFRKWFRRKQ